jgi:hypothetical protein
VDARPSLDELIEHVAASHAEGSLSPQQHAQLAALYDGTPESLQQLPSIDTLLRGAPGAAPASVPAASLPKILALNAFGDQYEDIAAATVKDSDPASQIGIWPLFAMMNHSCVPNVSAQSSPGPGRCAALPGPSRCAALPAEAHTPAGTRPNPYLLPHPLQVIHYVVGKHLVMRATQQVPAGEELCVSYLGLQDWAPAAARGQHLLDTYGFRCNCPRCGQPRLGVAGAAGARGRAPARVPLCPADPPPGATPAPAGVRRSRASARS